ncbi:pentatricopeptide repeat-containing protein At4g39530 [Syzygium oleosum]|uniref:pentatricopeptide repeat-containing protein At4g39530 n=1 Tax=Syzygium oleosum TaxID=219896 RepID=UPI0024BA3A5D|nr:pentatricopeptide repeat-containing protein At4g39530 [Syzygium oleosum]
MVARALLARQCRRISKATRPSSFAFSTFPSETPSRPLPGSRVKRLEFAELLQFPASASDAGDAIVHHKKLHGQMVVWGFQYDVFLANVLLHSYSKCGGLRDARRVFDNMPERNLITWSSVISMYARHSCCSEALMSFVEFQRSSVERPNEYILASLIRGCSQSGGLDEGAQVHGFVVKAGLGQDVYVGTSLVFLYANNGGIDGARSVFDSLLDKTAVTWTAIISGHVKCGRSEVSLQLFSQMIDAGLLPDKYVISSVLSACSALEFVEGGKQIHAHILRREAEMDISVVNVLIDCYMKSGMQRTARRLFDHMEVRNMISWTTMISGYMQNSYDKEALKLFAEMTGLGWNPDAFACTSVLTSCGSLEALIQGKQVHAYTIKANLEFDDFVKNGLIDMYAKCNALADARKLFDVMDGKNVVSYNAMIEGYSRLEKLEEALDIFHSMRLASFSPSPLTFVSILGLSTSLFTLELSKQVHGLLSKSGISVDLFAGSSLIYVYCKSSLVRDARLVFEEMNDRDIVVWNAMFSGYSQQMENEETFKLFSELQLSEQRPNGFTFASVITAASNLASLQHGQQFHSHIIKRGLDFDPFVANAVVDMYAKCGSIREARKAFDLAICEDVACWNSMITTYAQHGEARAALQIFEEMIIAGVKPNYITYVGILCACSHAGLVEDGLHHFNSMPGLGIEPGTEHYACMVSLFGRAGRLKDAVDFIETMPIQPMALVWRSLLSACRNAGDSELGKYAAEMAISWDPTDSGSYTLLSNIFASKGMWFDVKKVRQRMDETGVLKEPGKSWIEVNNEVHVFVARDQTHYEADLIFLVLDYLILQIKEIGYVPDNVAVIIDD